LLPSFLAAGLTTLPRSVTHIVHRDAEFPGGASVYADLSVDQRK
jgi:hypothetical protein